MGNAGLWQIWWALTDPAPKNQELFGAGKSPTGTSPAQLGPWLLEQKGKRAGNAPGGSSKWSPEVALIFAGRDKAEKGSTLPLTG